MAKNKKKSGLTPAQRQQAQAEARENQRRVENARKSRQMGMVFLYAVLSLVALFCLYLTLRTLFFPAASAEELEGNYLFVSILALPYLAGTAAVILRALQKRRAEARNQADSQRSGAVFLAVLLLCVLVLTGQLFGGRSDAGGQPLFRNVAEALEDSGLDFTPPEEVPGFRTLLLWDAAQARFACGGTQVLLDRCSTGFGIPGRLAGQAALDLSALTPEPTDWGTRWASGPAGTSAKGGLCLRSGSTVVILELTGPLEELETLYPALEQAVLNSVTPSP